MEVADDGSCGDAGAECAETKAVEAAGEAVVDGVVQAEAVETCEVLADGQLGGPRTEGELSLDNRFDELADALDLVVVGAAAAARGDGGEAEAALSVRLWPDGRCAGGDEVLDQLVAHHLLGDAEDAVEPLVLGCVGPHRGVSAAPADAGSVLPGVLLGGLDGGDADGGEGALGHSGELQRAERGHDGAGERVPEPFERRRRPLLAVAVSGGDLLDRVAAASAAAGRRRRRRHPVAAVAAVAAVVAFLVAIRDGDPWRTASPLTGALTILTVAVTVVQRTEHVVPREHAARRDRRELCPTRQLDVVSVVGVPVPVPVPVPAAVSVPVYVYVYVPVPTQTQHELRVHRRRRAGRAGPLRAALSLVSVLVAVAC